MCGLCRRDQSRSAGWPFMAAALCMALGEGESLDLEVAQSVSYGQCVSQRSQKVPATEDLVK